ncbi:MAG: hypothetical protein HQK89_08865 [Nitrospirae bacterium]|nr:hypothetical protein [Nitrospirota bacterium]
MKGECINGGYDSLLKIVSSILVSLVGALLFTLLALFLFTFVLPGCTQVQSQKANQVDVTSKEVATVAVTDAYTVAHVMWQAGQIDTKTYAAIEKDYITAQDTIKESLSFSMIVKGRNLHVNSIGMSCV